MARVLARDTGPMFEMNTTPLIDVMLVLLIMLIMTIPPRTHAVKLDLPMCPPPPTLKVNPVKNEVAVTAAGAILWNGDPVSKRNLAYQLELTRQMKPQPELHLRPDAAARYEMVDEVLAITRRAGVTNMGFVGNEQYREF